MAIKIGMNQSCIPSIPTLDYIELSADAGFNGVELRWEKILDEKISSKELTAKCKEKGIEIISLNALEMGNKEISAKSEELIKMAMELNTPLIVVPPRPPISSHEFHEMLHNISDTAKRYGTQLGFEFLGFTDAQINNIKQAAEISVTYDMRLIVDTFHYFLSREDPDELKKYDVIILHINDCTYAPAHPPQDDLARVLPGEGNFPLKKIIKNYHGNWISLEIFRRYKMPPKKFAHVAIETLKKLVSDAF
ncbi:MAG: sugar phosphate isomerase/epimerase [Candidatus Korarchaeota archaeon]